MSGIIALDVGFRLGFLRSCCLDSLVALGLIDNCIRLSQFWLCLWLHFCLRLYLRFLSGQLLREGPELLCRLLLSSRTRGLILSSCGGPSS